MNDVMKSSDQRNQFVELDILLIIKSIVCSTLLIILYYMYELYCNFMKPSKYMLATEKLGFLGFIKCDGQRITKEQQQEALLKIFYVAGYLELPNIWHDLNAIGDIPNVRETFKILTELIRKANGHQSDPNKFDATFLRKNLFKQNDLDVQDVSDLLLYIGQHAFGRRTGHERHETSFPENLLVHQQYYYSAVSMLNLVDRRIPRLNVYDVCWIAGASRYSLSMRIIELQKQLAADQIRIQGEILILTGNRELWANIDGLSTSMMNTLSNLFDDELYSDINIVSCNEEDQSVRIEEGKSYIIRLAQSNNIQLDKNHPFITYDQEEQCPPHRFPNRIYANYHPDERARLTESIMAKDLLNTYNLNPQHDIGIIHTPASEKGRPDTSTTVRDAIERLLRCITTGDYGSQKNFTVLFCSNNPFIERQVLVAQRVVNQIMTERNLTENYKIQIEGIGYGGKPSIRSIHSEIGALLAEKWIAAVDTLENTFRSKPKRPIEHLLFQTRPEIKIKENFPVRAKRF